MKYCTSYAEVLRRNELWMPSDHMNQKWSELEQDFGTEDVMEALKDNTAYQKVRAILQAHINNKKAVANKKIFNFD